jgi:hypothetical protein
VNQDDLFDRKRLKLYSLQSRENRVMIERDLIMPSTSAYPVDERQMDGVRDSAAGIRAARAGNRPVVVAFGAHLIKNGLAPVLMELIKQGWVTHLATNGAGIIHDWEFAYQGESSEDVRDNVRAGRFGHWEETGYYLNLALIVGAHRGFGYGESIGAMVHDDGFRIPERKQLDAEISDAAQNPRLASAAADVYWAIQSFGLQEGWMEVPHPYKKYGLQCACYELGVPFTSHPMFGHDIIYVHPMNHGSAVGRVAERDFLSFANTIASIDGGVYLSVGSAVMSPMVFEKSLAMAQNIALQEGRSIDDFQIYVIDLAADTWDWSKGEPPVSNPAYYVRFLKTFSRMGGQLRYIQCDNRGYLASLCRELAGG